MVCRDVLPQNFESYTSEVQRLICTADHLGALMQYDTPGFLPNRRIHRGATGKCYISYFMLYFLTTAVRITFFVCFLLLAMGLATLEVMQAMHRTWSNSKVRVNGKTRQMQWRDMFDIAVKWRRWGLFFSPKQPKKCFNKHPSQIQMSYGIQRHGAPGIVMNEEKFTHCYFFIWKKTCNLCHKSTVGTMHCSLCRQCMNVWVKIFVVL